MADSLSFDYDRYGALLQTGSDTADERLIQALRDCEEWAYEELISRFQQPVYNLVYRLLPVTDDCSDVVQEVFLKVFRNVGNFRAQSSLKTWIYRIAVNEAHNQRRWFSRHRRQEVALFAESDEERGLDETLPDQAPSAFDLVATNEAKLEVEQALTEVSPLFREAVVLRDIEELSYEEIAEVLGISLGTVKSRILRGRQALERVLKARAQGEYGALTSARSQGSAAC